MCNHMLRFLGEVTWSVTNREQAALGSKTCLLSGRCRCVGGTSAPPAFVYSKAHCRKRWVTELLASVQRLRTSAADCIQQVASLALVTTQNNKPHIQQSLVIRSSLKAEDAVGCGARTGLPQHRQLCSAEAGAGSSCNHPGRVWRWVPS